MQNAPSCRGSYRRAGAKPQLQMWKTLRTYVTHGSKDPDSRCGTGLKTTSDTSNDFVANTGPRINQELSVACHQLVDTAPAEVEHHFSLSSVSTKGVQGTVHSMATKAGVFDEVSVKVLKSSLDATISSVAFIISNSLVRDVALPRWRQAILIPVHKTGNKSNPKKFRYISLLPVVSKVAEGLVHR